jgi:hypothetical protein
MQLRKATKKLHFHHLVPLIFKSVKNGESDKELGLFQNLIERLGYVWPSENVSKLNLVLYQRSELNYYVFFYKSYKSKINWDQKWNISNIIKVMSIAFKHY